MIMGMIRDVAIKKKLLLLFHALASSDVHYSLFSRTLLMLAPLRQRLMGYGPHATGTPASTQAFSEVGILSRQSCRTFTRAAFPLVNAGRVRISLDEMEPGCDDDERCGLSPIMPFRHDELMIILPSEYGVRL